MISSRLTNNTLRRVLALSTATVSVIVCTVAMVAEPASAHSELISSTPAAGDTLTKAASEVELVFNEPVQEQGSTISVSVRDVVVSDSSTFTVDDTAASVQLTDGAQAGVYTVTFRIVSEDGHIVRDDYKYVVEPTGNTADPSDAPTSDTIPLSSTDSDESDSNGSVIWVLGAGAIGLVLVAALIAVAARGRRGRSS